MNHHRVYSDMRVAAWQTVQDVRKVGERADGTRKEPGGVGRDLVAHQPHRLPTGVGSDRHRGEEPRPWFSPSWSGSGSRALPRVEMSRRRGVGADEPAVSGVETLLVSTNPLYIFLASSLVKEVATYGGDLSNLLPPKIEQPLLFLRGPVAVDDPAGPWRRTSGPRPGVDPWSVLTIGHRRELVGPGEDGGYQVTVMSISRGPSATDHWGGAS